MNDHIDLQTVLKELHNISGFRISVHDTKFREVAAYPKEAGCFCGLIQQNDRAKRNCVDNDRETFDIVRREQKVYIYRCRFGLYEAVAPIYSFGELTGYLMMGQVLDTFSASRERVYNSALPYVKDAGALAEAVDAVPVSTKEKIRSCITIMDICAKYITLSNRIGIPKSNIAGETKRFISLNYHKKITIESLCGHFFCSRSTLMNSFKKTYSVSIGQYVQQVKMQKAAEMLRSGKSVKGASAACGFEDQNYFSKVFRRFYRVSPSEYKSRFRDYDPENPV